VILEFHPAVQQDFNHVIAYYEAEGGVNLADRFETEFRAALLVLKSGLTRFPPYHGSPLFRRVRLHGFPYLIIYRGGPNAIRVTLLKHERRHPLFGMTRW
jgi:plasmid stabilization system protein ParE